MRYLENFTPGEGGVVGTHRVTAEEIVAFARVWDPLPVHVDAEAAASSSFGGLIASGAHVMAISVRLLVSSEPVAIIAGLGWDEVRFLAPVRPGDALTLSRRCIEVRQSRSSPGAGVVRNELRLVNQSGIDVLSYTDAILVRSRPAQQT